MNITCQRINHENKQILGACINETCKEKKLFCFQCSKIEFHSHPDDVKEFQDLKEWFENRCLVFEEIKNQIKKWQQMINEPLQLMQDLLEKYCSQINFERCSELSYTKLEEKMFNLIALNKIRIIVFDKNIQDQISKTSEEINFNLIQLQEALKIQEESKQSQQILLQKQSSNLEAFSQLNASKQKEFYFEQGIELLLEKKSSEAVGEFDKAIKIDDQYLLGMKWKAYALLQLQDYEQSAQQCKQISKIDKQQMRAYLYCGICIEITLGQALMNCNNYPEALHSLKNALQICSNNKLALIYKGTVLQYSGQTLFKLKQYQESIDSYEVALGIDEKSPLALEGISKHVIILVCPLLQLQKFKEAQVYCDKILKYDPYNKRILATRAQLENTTK